MWHFLANEIKMHDWFLPLLKGYYLVCGKGPSPWAHTVCPLSVLLLLSAWNVDAMSGTTAASLRP